MFQINKHQKIQATRTKDHFQGDRLQENIFMKVRGKNNSNDFEFEVFSCPRFPGKKHFISALFLEFWNHSCQQIFWSCWISNSDVWINSSQFQNRSCAMWAEKKVKKFFSKSKVFKIWAFVSFLLFFASIQITVINVMILKFSFVKNIENFKHHLQKESIWNKTTFFKVQILYRGCGLSFTPLCNERTSSEISSLYKEDFVWFFWLLLARY